MAKNIQYPLISEYVDAIRSAEDNFDKLSDLRPVLDNSGNPVMSSGNFAVVFKMKDVRTGRMYAVKCFTREQEGREEAYRQIADELEFVQSSYLAKVRYYDHELFVDTNSSDDSEFPVLLMDWVEGETLDRYVRRNINDTYALEMLTYNFSRLAMWLLPQPFAHGDLKPDNILVQDDGSLTLVDYDGMYVPAMQGQKSRELGSPDFRHPLRTDADFNEHIDDFPAISILLSLRLIAADPSLLDSYGASDRLLFTESDYRDLSSCELLKSVFPSQNAEINILLSLFTIACTQKTLANVSFRLLVVAKPKKSEIIEVKEALLTRVSDEDLVNSVVDEAGVKYSKDGKRLLKFPNDYKLDTYSVKDGTEVICTSAFSEIKGSTIIGYDMPKHLHLPFSLKIIGDYALSCLPIESIIIPNQVYYLGKYVFAGCPYLKKIILPQECSYLGSGAFYNCSLLQYVKIPKNISVLEDMLFAGCEQLESINIPNDVTIVKDAAFCGCLKLNSILMSDSIKNISDDAFENCGKRSAYFHLCNRSFLERQVLSFDYPYADTDIITITINNEYKNKVQQLLKNNKSKNNISLKISEKTPFFDGLKKYASKSWSIKNERYFTEEEKNMVSDAIIVSSHYGKIVQFNMKVGKPCFITCSSDSILEVGDHVDINHAEIVTMWKDGFDDIVRIRCI